MTTGNIAGGLDGSSYLYNIGNIESEPHRRSGPCAYNSHSTSATSTRRSRTTRSCFGATLNKRKPGYANFAIEQPPLKLVLFENPDAGERLNHLGVEVFEQADVTAATERLKAADMADKVEDEQTCCYASQNKVWSVDPQGTRWEWYRVLEDSETFGSGVSGERRATSADSLREQVREGYTRVAEAIGDANREDVDDASRRIGYSDDQLAAVPDGANLGVGCGNPTAIDARSAPARWSWTWARAPVMDAFLAARQVGPTGRVIGVDMTDAMLEPRRARTRVKVPAYENVEFRKGRIEKLPDRGRECRRDPLELRHQPLPREGPRLPRGLPGAAAGRPA